MADLITNLFLFFLPFKYNVNAKLVWWVTCIPKILQAISGDSYALFQHIQLTLPIPSPSFQWWLWLSCCCWCTFFNLLRSAGIQYQFIPQLYTTTVTLYLHNNPTESHLSSLSIFNIRKNKIEITKVFIPVKKSIGWLLDRIIAIRKSTLCKSNNARKRKAMVFSIG